MKLIIFVKIKVSSETAIDKNFLDIKRNKRLFLCFLEWHKIKKNKGQNNISDASPYSIPDHQEDGIWPKKIFSLLRKNHFTQHEHNTATLCKIQITIHLLHGTKHNNFLVIENVTNIPFTGWLADFVFFCLFGWPFAIFT